MKNYKNLIQDVINKDLCCYCGTCEGVCPVNSIELSLSGLREINKCEECGLCYACCPGKKFDFKYFNNLIFKKKLKEVDEDIGFYEGIYKGFSNNKIIREKSSSGGIITAILVSLFEEKMIDAAIVAGNNNNNALQSDVLIARDKKSILEACQSKYTIISTNKILKQMEHSGKSFAFVGLPCQIHGLRNAEENIKWLKKKIKVRIGLFCGFNLYPAATNYLLKKLKINSNDIKSLEYRGGGKPGGFKVTRKDGKSFFIDKHAYTYLNMIFTPKRCLQCYDLTSEFSDISVGDAWEETGGDWSRIIIRTENGGKIMQRLLDKKLITIKNSSKQDIVDTQNHLIKYKKEWFWLRFHLFKNKADYNIDKKPVLSIPGRMNGLIFFLIQLIFGSTFFKKIILPVLPFNVCLKISRVFRNHLINKNKNR